MKIGIGIGEIANQAAGLSDVVAQAKQAEAEGFASGWFANIMGVDAFTAVTICSRETSRIELGTAVVPTYLHHPVAMAQLALSVRAASDGRFSLGIGLSHRVVVEGMLGLSWDKPFSHMKEYLSVVAPLIRAGTASFTGKEFRVNASLAVPGASPCPILLAALAPKMLELAGSVGDGTITWMTGPKTLREHTIPRIREAAARAGRPAPRIVVGLPVAVTPDVTEARAAAARVFQTYGFLPSYRAMLDREGAEGPADLAMIGDADAVGEQMDRLAEIGVTDFLGAPYPIGKGNQASVERTREFLAGQAKRRNR